MSGTATTPGERPGAPRYLRAVLLAVLACALPLGAQGQTARTETCPDGVVARIDIENQAIYPVDESDPRLLRWAFGTANLLHVETTKSFIRRELLFEEGDCFDAFLVSESRRLLDDYRFIAEAQAETVEESPGQWVVTIRTRDEWSTQIDVRLTVDDGLNFERVQATEENFLGNGVTAEVTHSERRERRDRNARIFTPRFFGRTDADIRVGTTRGGSFFYQQIDRGFLGETNRFSGSELYDRGTSFYTYATGADTGNTHILLPVTHQRFELAAATRLGEPGRSWILGLSLDRSVFEQKEPTELVFDEDFGDPVVAPDTVPAAISRQATTRGATRVGLHVGTRRFRYVDYIGLDAIREREVVPLGFFGGVSVGRSLGILLPDSIPDADDTYTRLFTEWTIPLGQSLLHLTGSAEAARADGGWRDVLAQAAVAAYARADWLPNQTLFFRASTGGGWRTTIPFQLSLGGRTGVRSLRDDVLPAGRRVFLLVEDRIRFDWPSGRAIGLGATVFADAGKVWAGDAPFGTDSDWAGSVGFGLRVAVPSSSRTIWRPEIAFPVGHDGSPVFRMTFEVNRIRFGFTTPRWAASRRFSRGAEAY